MLALLCLAGTSYAQLPQVRLSGVSHTLGGAVNARGELHIYEVRRAGSNIPLGDVRVSTNSSGQWLDPVDRLPGFNVPRGAQIRIFSTAPGYNSCRLFSACNADPANGVWITTDPDATTALVDNLISTASVATTGIVVKYNGSPLTGPFGTLNFTSPFTATGSGGAATVGLAASGVGAGSCNACNLSYDAYGRLTAASTGGSAAIVTLLGDTLYATGPGALARLAGNTSATKKFLSQTGDATNSAAPAWGTIATGDLPSSIPLSKLAITGTPDGSKFLRDDGSWQTVAGGVTSFNSRTGTVLPAANDYAVADINGLASALSAKQDSLGFTAENVANKATSFSTVNDTKYPTVQAVANYVGATSQPLSSVLNTYAGIAPSANVQTLLGAADYAAFRSSLGLGTLATQSGTFSGTSSGTNTGDQTPTSLGLLIGTNVEAWSANLDSWSAKTPYAGALTVTTGKTAAFSNSLTLAGTDGSTLNIGTGGNLGTAAFTAASAYEVPLTFSSPLSRSVNAISLLTNVNYNFTEQQTITKAGTGLLVTGGNGSNNRVKIELTNSNTGGSAQLDIYNATAQGDIAIEVFGSAQSGTLVGVTKANLTALQSAGSFLLNTTANVPVVIGVNNSEVGRFVSTGLTVTGSLSTSDPTSGAGAVWKLGSKKTGSLTLDTGNYIEISVAGVTYKVALVN
jgi:hypothetical protein